MNNFLNRVYFGNTVEDYLWFLGMLLLAFLFKRVISKYLSRLIFSFIKKRAEGVEAERLFHLLRKPLGLLIMLLIFFIATSHIEFPGYWKLAPDHKWGIRMFLLRTYQVLLIFTFTWLATRLVDFAGLVLMKRAEATVSKHDDQLIPFAIEMGKIFVAILGFFIVLGSVFNLNIASLIAGLGIGGLAIALAAKESLENLLASFTIFLDKPFVVGDQVQVGNITGTVEKVGFRSTRIRTPEKTYLTIPNKKMVDTELDNLTLRTFRRAKTKISLPYTSTSEQVKNITTTIKRELDNHVHTTGEASVRFVEFGSSALEIAIEYFIDCTDGEQFLEIKESLNLKIIDIVRSHGSDFAYPTTMVYLNHEKTSTNQ